MMTVVQLYGRAQLKRRPRWRAILTWTATPAAQRAAARRVTLVTVLRPQGNTKVPFCVFDKATGLVKRTGRCRLTDLAIQVGDAGEDVIQTATHLHPDETVVDLPTRTAKPKT